MAIEALQGAFAEYRRRRLVSYDGDDPLICTCFGVSEAVIVKAVRQHGLNSVEEVASVCRAGLGCGSCRMLIQEIIDELSAP
jgi:NifU-like protein